MKHLSTSRETARQAIWKEFDRMTAQTLTTLLQTFMEEERDAFLGCASHQRSEHRRGYRNGYESRYLDTRKGRLKLRVPRVRNTPGPWRTLVFAAYQRRSKDIEAAIEQWVACGCSTRAIEHLLDNAFDCFCSATTISRVIAKIDAQLQTFHQRDLTHGYRVVFFDAKYGYVCRTRKNGRRGKRKKSVLLSCWGIRHDGREELVDFMACEGGETEANWIAFLTQLEQRGLKRRNPWEMPLEMIVSDGDAGLEAALWMVYPHVPRQRCVFHKIKNIADHLHDRNHRQAILASASDIYQDVKTLPEALAKCRQWSARWQELEPDAVKNFTAEFARTILYLNLDPRLWRRCRTTNPLERFHLEMEKATGHVGAWQNQKSWERHIYLIWRKCQQTGYAPIMPKPQFTRNS